MNDVQRLLAETATQVFSRHAAPGDGSSLADGSWSPGLWRVLDETGLTLVGVPEERGGGGGSLQDAALLVGIAARYAAAVPLGETCLLAGWLLDAAGLSCPPGPLTAALVVDGRSRDVPYARDAAVIAVLVDAGSAPMIGLVRPDEYRVEPDTNLAGEPRDTVVFDPLAGLTPAPPVVDAQAFRLRGALLRTIQMGGALQRVLEMTVAYAAERRQFGVAISRFQAAQQMLATMAGEVEAATAAVAAAVDDPAPDRIAAAKVRAGDAAGQVATMAHQVHGAIGVTEEYQLHRLTRRLWAWRDEFGSERLHAVALGEALAAAGPERIWAWISGDTLKRDDSNGG
jgi:acyl-CoA dehydrogenase